MQQVKPLRFEYHNLTPPCCRKLKEKTFSVVLRNPLETCPRTNRLQLPVKAGSDCELSRSKSPRRSWRRNAKSNNEQPRRGRGGYSVKVESKTRWFAGLKGQKLSWRLSTVANMVFGFTLCCSWLEDAELLTTGFVTCCRCRPSH